MTRPIRAWFRNVFGRPAVERALDEEVRACVEILTAERVDAGMDPKAARREALMEIGNVESVKEGVRDVRRGSRLEAWGRDLRHGRRSLRRQPWVTTAVVVTLTIGIAIPASVVNLIGAFAWRPPASADPDAFFRVVRPNSTHSGIATLSQYVALRDRTTSTRDLAAWSSRRLRAPLGVDESAPVVGLLASCNVFSVFGVNRPSAGRLLNDSDCESDRPVAVLDEGLWQSRFASDPGIVGTTMRFGGVPITVVGVAAMPPFVHQWDDPDLDVALWFPNAAFPSLKQTSSGHWHVQNPLDPADPSPWLEIAGLLAPGVSRRQATAEFRAIVDRMAPDRDARAQFVLSDGSRMASAPLEFLAIFAMALVLPALILLVACTNAAGLLLSRAIRRQREMAARLALGASRGGLVRLLMLEGVVLAAAASAASLLLVYSVPRILVALWDASATFGPAATLTPDWRVLTFLAVTALLAAVGASIAPALESLNPRLAETLQGRTGLVFRRHRARTRHMLVAIQVGACLVLLVTAGSFVRTAGRFVNPGFRTDGLLVAHLADPDRGTASLRVLAEELAAIPGVRSVARSDLLPLVRENALRILRPGDTEEVRPIPLTAEVSPEYFGVFGLPILAGRGFRATDWVPGDATQPAVVSRQFVQRFFGNAEALGETLELSKPAGGGRLTVIGIVEDRLTGLSSMGSSLNDGSVIYRMMDPDASSGYLTIWAAGDPDDVAGRVAARLRDLTGAARNVEPFELLLAERLVMTRHLVTLLFALGGTALLLAVLGIVGMVTADAARRAREFAIRLALGASPGAIRRHVVRSGLGLLPIGLGAGLFASWGVLRLVEAQRLVPLASIARDPVTYGAVVVILTAVAFVAVLGVAYPVGRRDPLVALREE